MNGGRRVLDADAHVIEPGGLFGRGRPADVAIDLPADHAAGPVRRLRPARRPVRARLRRPVVPAGDGRAGHRRRRPLPVDRAVRPVPARARRRRRRPARAAPTTTGSPATAPRTRRGIAGVGIVPLVDPGRAVTRGRRAPPTSAWSACWPGPTTCTAATSATPRTTRCYAALAGGRARARGARGPRPARARRSAPTASAASPPATLLSHPMEQMAAHGEPRARRRARAAPDAAGRVPRVGHRAGCRTGSHRLDEHHEWMRDTESRGPVACSRPSTSPASA